MSTKQITIEEISQYLAEKYITGRQFEEVSWDDIDHRLGRFFISDEQEREVRQKLTDAQNQLPRAEGDEKEPQECVGDTIILKPWRFSF